MQPDNPLELFHRWQQHAGAQLGTGGSALGRVHRAVVAPLRWALRPLFGELPGTDAAALATASGDGAPSVRVVLVKEATDEGFVFYTNYTSRKARELSDNPRAALAFHWPFPPRQIRIEGSVEPLSSAQNEAYWQTRPRGSQLSALGSRQSSIVPSREALERSVAARAAQYPQGPIPCPEFWGGYRLCPTRIEFWEARADRLHDRWQYQREAPGAAWRVDRLAP